MKFLFDELFAKAQRLARKRGGDITINLPFISFAISAQDIERKVARELMIRLPDKRVLASKECCDDCIENSLPSVQAIRAILVDKQVELSHVHDGSLYLLIEFMAEGIRQFLTATEPLSTKANNRTKEQRYRGREQYFAALEQLRFHLHSCLQQVAKVAEMETPKVAAFLRSARDWEEAHYLRPSVLGQLPLSDQSEKQNKVTDEPG